MPLTETFGLSRRDPNGCPSLFEHVGAMVNHDALQSPTLPLLSVVEVNVRRVSHCPDHFWNFRSPLPQTRELPALFMAKHAVHE